MSEHAPQTEAPGAASSHTAQRKRLAWALALTVLTFVLYKMSLMKPLDHDEHQFIASGATLARFGWLPYRDAPYHHLPYLSFLYALLFSWSDQLLLSARAACVAASVGVVGLTSYAVAEAFGRHSVAVRNLAAAAAAIMLISNPLFVYTSGRAWNHDPATLLALAAALLHMRWLAGAAKARSIVAAGALLGLAIGTRSSFALLIPAFAASFAVVGVADRTERLRATALFAAGGFVSLLPIAYLLAAAPEQFVFGNLRYNFELNTQYREAIGWPVAMDLSGKLDYLASEVLSHRRNGLLLLLYVVSLGSAAVIGGLRQARAQHGFLLLTVAALACAAASPTPTWYQYFFPTVPFVIIASAHAVAAHDRLRRAVPVLLVTAALMLTSVAGLRHYVAALSADQNPVAATRAQAERLAEISSPGRVATLRPIIALQAAREIYPWLATGPFSWRTVSLVEPQLRQALTLVGPDEVAAVLDLDPPVAILTGVASDEDTIDDDSALEAPLIAYARSKGFRSESVGDGLVAWLPPAAPAGR